MVKMIYCFVPYFTQVLLYAGNEPGNFDIVIVNDQLERAYGELRTYLLPFIKQVQH